MLLLWIKHIPMFVLNAAVIYNYYSCILYFRQTVFLITAYKFRMLETFLPFSFLNMTVVLYSISFTDKYWRSSYPCPATQDPLHRVFCQEPHQRWPVLLWVGENNQKVPGSRATPVKTSCQKEQKELCNCLRVREDYRKRVNV